MARIDQRDALDVLTKPRLVAIAGAVGLDLPAQLRKVEIVDAIASSQRAPFPLILSLLKRDELKAICRAAGIDDSDRPKARIADRILGHRPGGEVTLTKADLAEDLAVAEGLLKREAEAIVDAMLAAMTESLRSGSSIEVRGFGSFRLRDRAARIGRNPATGAEVRIPAKRVCYFTPRKALVEAVNS
jgi:integration host factor subunit beta